jgi:hypothetical protein
MNGFHLYVALCADGIDYRASLIYTPTGYERQECPCAFTCNGRTHALRMLRCVPN